MQLEKSVIKNGFRHSYIVTGKNNQPARKLYETHEVGEINAKSAFEEDFEATQTTIDEIIKEPLGGVTLENIDEVVAALRCRIIKITEELKSIEISKLLNDRYAKFRKMGEYKVNKY